MNKKTVAKLLRLGDPEFTEYELSLPIKDLDEFFVAMDWYSEYLHKEYVITELNGFFDFLLYENNLDIKRLNELLLRFQILDEEEQELVLFLTHLNSDTVDGFEYSLNNHTKYVMVPITCRNEEEISRFVINKISSSNFLRFFEDSICYEDFFQLLFKHQIAFDVDNRFIIKLVELFD